MDTSARFAFGENWADYAKTVGNDQLESAIVGVKRLLPAGFDPADKSFLDIGSGSGLHAVAAHRLGFGPITATDYDENSVSTTKAVALKLGAPVEAFRDDILNTTITSQLDVVYSWGVLHHTGDMKRAIENAGKLVKLGGLFIIAIYVKTPMCGVWHGIKETYCRSPAPVKKAMIYGYYGALTGARIAKGAIRGRYNEARGMDKFYDAIDWLGGYPYESATAGEVNAMVGSGFRPLASFNTAPGRGLFGTGCAEYVFAKADIGGLST